MNIWPVGVNALHVKNEILSFTFIMLSGPKQLGERELYAQKGSVQ